MDARTLEALKGSIKKWEGIALELKENHGTHDCPLCQLFHGGRCEGCPVKERTGLDCCDGTPYWDYVRYADEYGTVSGYALAIADKELEFLRSLLPEGEK